MGYNVEINDLKAVEYAKIDSKHNAVIGGINGSGKSTIARNLYAQIYIDANRDNLEKKIKNTLEKNLINSFKDLYRYIYKDKEAYYFDLFKRKIFVKSKHDYEFDKGYNYEHNQDDNHEEIHDKFSLINDYYYDEQNDEEYIEKRDFGYSEFDIQVTPIDPLLYDDNKQNSSNKYVGDIALVELTKNNLVELRTIWENEHELANYEKAREFFYRAWLNVCLLENYKKLFENSIKNKNLYEKFMKINFSMDSYKIFVNKIDLYKNVYFFDLESKYFDSVKSPENESLYVLDDQFSSSPDINNDEQNLSFPNVDISEDDLKSQNDINCIKGILPYDEKEIINQLETNDSGINYAFTLKIESILYVKNNYDLNISGKVNFKKCFSNNRMNELVEKFGLRSIVQKKYILFELYELKNMINSSDLSSGQRMIYAIISLVYKISLNEILDNKVIFIDEPELHLHPEFQMYYGEFLALASLEYNIDFIIITHSLYIIDSFNVYMKKYSKKTDMLDIYISKKSGGRYICKKQQKKSEIYDVLLSPYDILDRVEEEISLE
jgi:predicted ATPase